VIGWPVDDCRDVISMSPARSGVAAAGFGKNADVTQKEKVERLVFPPG